MGHLEELQKRLIRVFLTVAIIIALSFTITIKNTYVKTDAVNVVLHRMSEFLRWMLETLGTFIPPAAEAAKAFGGGSVGSTSYLLFYPYPDPFHNMCSQLLRQLQHDLLPDFVQVIVTTPWQALVALFYTALFIGITLGMPMIVYQLGKFIAPGLYPHEKRMIVKMIIPACCLFVGGILFSYLLVTPFVINYLYLYAIGMEVITYLTIDSFISFILMFLISFGIAFQLPLIMIGLSSAGVIEPEFWKNNFRYAVVAMCVFGAAITPDGSGVTMFIIAGPMILLYVAGYWIAAHRKVK